MKFLKLVLAFILSFPIVSAYSPLSYYLRSPAQLLQNEWILFILIFSIFFAVTYFAVVRTFAGHKGVAVVVAAAVSIFIAGAVSQKAWYYGYLGESIGSWFLLIASIIGFLLLLKVISGMFGGIGMLAILFFGWYFISKIDVYDLLPYAIINSDAYPIVQFIASPDFGWVLGGITVLLFITAYMGHGKTPEKVRNWLWGKKKKKTLAELLSGEGD